MLKILSVNLIPKKQASIMEVQEVPKWELQVMPKWELLNSQTKNSQTKRNHTELSHIIRSQGIGELDGTDYDAENYVMETIQHEGGKIPYRFANPECYIFRYSLAKCLSSYYIFEKHVDTSIADIYPALSCQILAFS